MRYVSTFSGIEAATVAWEPLGWEPMAFCEVDSFPSAVLAERYPEVPNLGDIREVDWRKYRGKADLVVGGSPCQSFSVAGKREGLKGESGLMLEYVRAVREVRPRWLLWENVPGALSSERGEAFRCLLSALDDLGYGLAWRVLDAQFFRVAQRRRRLFVVGRLGACPPVEVLLEPDGMRGDHPTSRGKRKELARAAGHGAAGEGCYGISGNVIGRADGNGGHQLGVVDAGDSGMFSLTATDRHAVVCLADDNAKSAVDVDMCGSLKVGGAPPMIGMKCFTPWDNDGTYPTLVSRSDKSGVNRKAVFAAAGRRFEIRRLTPRECERLQGFPDDWTLIPWRGKPAGECPDAPRYKAIGNSMAVPVMRWIGGRIDMAERGLL